MEKQVEAAPDKQVSMTDPDARSMATSGKGTGIVGKSGRGMGCSLSSIRCLDFATRPSQHRRALGGCMEKTFLRGLAAMIVMLAVVAGPASTSGAENATEIDAFNKQADLEVSQLSAQGKHAEAIAAAQQALSHAEQVLGKEHTGTLPCMNRLVSVYIAQGRYAQADVLVKYTNGYATTHPPIWKVFSSAETEFALSV